MTDHPRFGCIKGASDDIHLAYHGGGAVRRSYWLADTWLRPRQARRLEGMESGSGIGPRRVGLLAALFTVAVGAVSAFPLESGEGARLAALQAPVAGARAQCAGPDVEVTAELPEDRAATCAAASWALEQLGRCDLSLGTTLHISIQDHVRQTLGRPVFGLYDPYRKRVLVTRPSNVRALVEDTPYASLRADAFYKSLVIHEVVHGVLHQNLTRPAMSHAAYEYPAYALQIESLPPDVRDAFLQSFDATALRSATVFNDAVLMFDPYFFAARAYYHFKAAADGCEYLRELTGGTADFIAPNPM